MRHFLKNIFIFLIPTLVGFVLFLLLMLYSSNKASNYKLDSTIIAIYIGDSHIQHAVNDSILKNSKNIASESESLYYTYFKLNSILSTNSNICNVYLGFSYHSLSNYHDDFINGEFSSYISPNYFSVIPLNEKCKVFFWNINHLSSYTKRILKQSVNTILFSEFYHLGGFSNNFMNTKAVDSSIDKRIKFQYYYKDNTLRPFSSINIFYLNKIIKLCESKGVELILLKTPLNSDYY